MIKILPCFFAYFLTSCVSGSGLIDIDNVPSTTTTATVTTVATVTTQVFTPTSETTTSTTVVTDDTDVAVVIPNDASEILFDDINLPQFDLTLSQASINSLRSDPYTYVEGTLTYGAQVFYPVGVRTKGQNSWQSIDNKPSLKVKLDWVKDFDLYGLEELTLNAMNDDPTMMHERLAYRLYREVGIPSARATHAWVTINAEDYGVYTHIETVDKDMMKRWFEDVEGPMFEQWDVDFYDSYIPCPNPDAGQPCFELEFGKDDRTGLQGIADALESGSASSKMDAAGKWLDVEGFIRYWAAGVVVGQYDSYPYGWDDCHLFTQSNGLLLYIPHGVDETFSSSGGDMDGVSGIIASTCKSDSSGCHARWKEVVWEFQVISETFDLLAFHDEVAEQIAPLIKADPRHDHGSYSTVRYYQNDMRDFISTRRQEITQQLGAQP